MRFCQVFKRVLNRLKNSEKIPRDLPSSHWMPNAFVSSTHRKRFSVSAQNLGDSGGKNAEERLSVTSEEFALLREDDDDLRSSSVKSDVELGTVKPNSENEGSVGRNRVGGSLWALFAGEETKQQKRSLKRTDYGCEDNVSKELSPDMLKFANHLYLGGYLKEANFMHRQNFNSACFENGFARGFLRFAAGNFTRDHQEIAKWLSAVDLKQVAVFGCPSLGLQTIRAAKDMRRFFEIDEKESCARCKLNNVCTQANKSFNKSVKELHLDGVTRILTMYAMELTPQQLVVSEEIKKSVSRLLNEIINLSKTVTRDLPKTR